MKTRITILLFILIAGRIFGQSPWLDKSFNFTGVFCDSLKFHSLSANSINLQTNGSIVLAGANGSFITGITDFGVTRISSSGVVDTSFGTKGLATISLGTGISVAYASALQTDGKIVVIGCSYNGADFDFGILRLNIDGTPDSLFDLDGKVESNLSMYDDIPTCLVIQSDGKIVVAGYTTDGTHTGRTLARYLTNGSLDTSFNGTGKVISNFLNLYEKPSAIALNNLGQIILAGGTATTVPYGEVQLLRYNSNGTLDLSFGNMGEVSTNIGSYDDAASSIIIQPDNKIVIAGSGDDDKGGMSPAFYQYIFARYLPNGDLDTTFSQDGIQLLSVGNQNNFANAIALDANGKILAAGYSTNCCQFDYDYSLMRLTSSGELDSTFGDFGTLSHPILTGDDLGNSMLIQPDGKILVAGVSFDVNVASISVARYFPELPVGLQSLNLGNNNLLIYPNPITDKLNIQFTLQSDEIILLEIFDLTGKLVHQFSEITKGKSGLNKQTLNIPSSLSKGNYILRLITNENATNKKIIIN